MKRGLGLIALVSLMATGIVADRADAATPITFNVTIGSPLSYVFNGGAPDQVLGLVPGKTYQFLMSAADASAHPFFIATTTGVEPPTPFVDPGLTGNGTANIMFTVPTTPIPQIFYQCSVHSFMTNKIVAECDGGSCARRQGGCRPRRASAVRGRRRDPLAAPQAHDDAGRLASARAAVTARRWPHPAARCRGTPTPSRRPWS